MINEIEKQWIHGLCAILISLLLLVFSSQLKYGGVVADMSTRILNIPEYPVRKLREGIIDLSMWFHSKDRLYSRVRILEEENTHLRTKLNISEAVSLARQIDQSSDIARVTFRAPSSWWSEFRINKGLSDGLVPGQLVLQDGALVGRIAAVEKSFSWVELISSSSLLVPAVVEETREVAVVAGDDMGDIWLLYLPDNSNASEGMTVSTAIVNDMSPPGIPIGTISGTDSYYLGGAKAIPLEMKADLSRLYEVSAISYEENVN